MWSALLAAALPACGSVVVDMSSTSTGAAGNAGEGGAGGTTSGAGGTGTITETFCECATSADCPAGFGCDGCVCVPECGPGSPCPDPLVCCGGVCSDLQFDAQNCGACGNVCDLPHANDFCQFGYCGVEGCDQSGYSDCNGKPEDGCETMGPCACVPGEVAPCYSGPAGTEGVGVCAAGTKTCLDGVSWSPCEGEVLPSEEQCDGLDDDCDGHGDAFDFDGDGWSMCDGDCCDGGPCALYPEEVNPGAFEYPANGQDDDCDPTTLDDQPYPTCGPPALNGPLHSLILLQAMDLCFLTVENPPLPQRRWGVISGQITLADGSSQPNDLQGGVLADFGTNVLPKYGPTMAAISSGTARDEDDPGHVYPQNGGEAGEIGNYKAMTQAPIPADFLAANGGSVPSSCAPCAGPACGTAFDSIALNVRIRVPTNAGSLSFRSNFFTAEYPENICSQYNDTFVALLDSQSPLIPPDKNIAFDAMNNLISVNSALFSVCASCVNGTTELEGTGVGGWDGVLYDGASTGWLSHDAPVVPGETIELRFIVWDAEDPSVDSLVLLDRFRWNLIHHPQFP